MAHAGHPACPAPSAVSPRPPLPQGKHLKAGRRQPLLHQAQAQATLQQARWLLGATGGPGLCAEHLHELLLLLLLLLHLAMQLLVLMVVWLHLPLVELLLLLQAQSQPAEQRMPGLPGECWRPCGSWWRLAGMQGQVCVPHTPELLLRWPWLGGAAAPVACAAAPAAAELDLACCAHCGYCVLGPAAARTPPSGLCVYVCVHMWGEGGVQVHPVHEEVRSVAHKKQRPPAQCGRQNVHAEVWHMPGRAHMEARHMPAAAMCIRRRFALPLQSLMTKCAESKTVIWSRPRSFAHVTEGRDPGAMKCLTWTAT